MAGAIADMAREAHNLKGLIGGVAHVYFLIGLRNRIAVGFRQLRPALHDSYADLFHAAGLRNALILLQGAAAPNCETERLQRAVGVIYRPETELLSHYFQARLSEQFDAVLFFDGTRAIEPL
jgi:erythromycin esterase-like protein